MKDKNNKIENYRALIPWFTQPMPGTTMAGSGQARNLEHSVCLPGDERSQVLEVYLLSSREPKFKPGVPVWDMAFYVVS